MILSLDHEPPSTIQGGGGETSMCPNHVSESPKDNIMKEYAGRIETWVIYGDEGSPPSITLFGGDAVKYETGRRITDGRMRNWKWYTSRKAKSWRKATFTKRTNVLSIRVWKDIERDGTGKQICEYGPTFKSQVSPNKNKRMAKSWSARGIRMVDEPYLDEFKTTTWRFYRTALGMALKGIHLTIARGPDMRTGMKEKWTCLSQDRLKQSDLGIYNPIWH
jgi:hypothetical protein